MNSDMIEDILVEHLSNKKVNAIHADDAISEIRRITNQLLTVSDLRALLAESNKVSIVSMARGGVMGGR